MNWEHIGSADVKRSQKRRICSWCGEGIEIGQPYHCDFGKWEGEPVRCEVHPECHDALERDSGEPYTPYDQVRGITREEQVTYDDGSIAWDKERPRTPPVDLSPEDSAIWLRGWDAEEADHQERLAIIAQKGAGEATS